MTYFLDRTRVARSVRTVYRAALILFACSAVLNACVRAEPDVFLQGPQPGEPKFISYLDMLKGRYEDRPTDLELLLAIRKLESAAVDHYLRAGVGSLNQQQYSVAREQLALGLSIVPDHPRLLAELQHVNDVEEAEDLFAQGTELREKRQFKSSLYVINRALSLSPKNRDFQEFARDVENEYRKSKRDQFKIDLKFSEIEIKDAYRFVAKNFGINLVFDSSVKEGSLSLDMEDISFVSAIELISRISHNRFKVLDPHTLIIYADTKQKQEEYRVVQVESFLLETMAAKDMAGILKSVLGIKDVTINENANKLIVSASREELNEVEKIIRENDVSPGEVVLNVEILEINLNDAQRLGVNFGNYRLSTTTPSIPISDPILDSYNSVTTLNIPSVTLDAFKQAVAAKSLAQPSIRVLDGEKAKIHIGDRVPLRKASIQDATGQTRTTFEYQEIGIRFNVEANIHSDDKVTVKLNLEVSSLGENLGTPTEQAFRIGTRNADTTMLVNNGETVILGGLLREEGRSTRSDIYGVHRVPLASSLLGSKDNSQAQTDVLLTVTPQIVRNIRRSFPSDLTERARKEYLIPSELDTLSLKRPDKPVSLGEQVAEPKVVVGTLSANSENSVPKGPEKIDAPSKMEQRPTSDAFALEFDRDLYLADPSEIQQIGLEVDSSTLEQIDLDIKVNANIINIKEYLLLDQKWRLEEKELSAGVLRISLVRVSKPDNSVPSGASKFLSISIEPKRKGTSFLVAQVVAVRGLDVETPEKISPASAKVRVD